MTENKPMSLSERHRLVTRGLSFLVCPHCNVRREPRMYNEQHNYVINLPKWVCPACDGSRTTEVASSALQIYDRDRQPINTDYDTIADKCVLDVPSAM